MRFLKSLRYALAGISQCARLEKNFRLQLLFAITIVLVAAFFKISTSEWIALIFCIMVVLSLEMINSAIEKTCDLVTTEIHPLIKQIKDIAAGAVLLASAGSVVTACIIFIPRLYLLFKNFHQ